MTTINRQKLFCEQFSPFVTRNTAHDDSGNNVGLIHGLKAYIGLLVSCVTMVTWSTLMPIYNMQRWETHLAELFGDGPVVQEPVGEDLLAETAA